MSAAIYEITNTRTDTTYIGSSSDVRERINRHRLHLRQGVHRNSHLQRSWNKHGEAAFEFSVIESIADRSRLIEREQWHIDHGPRRLFNNIPANEAPMQGRTHNAETRAKISAGVRASGYVYTDEQRAARSVAMKNRVISPETRAKIRAGLLGKTHSDERRAKVSKANTGNPKLMGLKHSAETRATMNLKKKGVPLSAEHRAKLRKQKRKRVQAN